MIRELQKSVTLRLLPEEKLLDAMDTQHDQCIAIGWNMYREDLIKKLYPESQKLLQEES